MLFKIAAIQDGQRAATVITLYHVVPKDDEQELGLVPKSICPGMLHVAMCVQLNLYLVNNCI